MPRSLLSWYSLADLDRLAQREAVLEDRIPVQRLGRLAELVAADSGEIEARMKLSRSTGDILNLTLECGAELELTCQRCLEPMRFESSSRVELALLETEASASALPDGQEFVALDGDRLNPGQLVEDEMIVSLPLVAKHASRDECGSLAVALDQVNEKTEMSDEPTGSR